MTGGEGGAHEHLELHCPSPKLAAKSNSLSARRALVDAPDATRKVLGFKRLSLTDFKVDIPRLASKKVLSAKLAEDGQ